MKHVIGSIFILTFAFPAFASAPHVGGLVDGTTRVVLGGHAYCVLKVLDENNKKWGLVAPEVVEEGEEEICKAGPQEDGSWYNAFIQAADTEYIIESGIIKTLKSEMEDYFFLWLTYPPIDIVFDDEGCPAVRGDMGAKRCGYFFGNTMYEQGEVPNSIGVTNSEEAFDGLKKMLAETNQWRSLINLEEADYLMVLMQHFDEDQITYFSIKKGRNVKPKLLFSQNIVDLAYDFPKMSKVPLAWALFIEDIPEWHYDEFEQMASFEEGSF